MSDLAITRICFFVVVVCWLSVFIELMRLKNKS
jgi:hypothetical protein